MGIGGVGGGSGVLVVQWFLVSLFFDGSTRSWHLFSERSKESAHRRRIGTLPLPAKTNDNGEYTITVARDGRASRSTTMNRD